MPNKANTIDGQDRGVYSFYQAWGIDSNDGRCANMRMHHMEEFKN